MYEPPDPAWVAELVRDHPFATLVVVADGVPLASHVPVVGRLDADSGRFTFVGHMNRMNPLWAAIGEGCPALLIFTGPHGYVSPSVYGFTPAAPTWNFAVVHAAGGLTPLPPGAATLDVITATVEALESRLGDGWQMHDSLEYFDRLLPGVAAFSLRAEKLDAMYKLSQEQEPAVRAKVADFFEHRHASRGSGLATLMRRCLDGDRERI